MRNLSLKLILFFVCCLITSSLQAQISVGLRESAMGNSGAAITESSAPSFYNPALLAERQKSYFSVTGTTLTSFKSKSDTEEFNSTKFAPNYLSSIHAFENYVHEFSLVNQISLDARTSSPITDGTKNTSIRTDQYNLAYSFAFRNFPFGFQLGLRINESSFNVNQSTNDGNIATGANFDISRRTGHLFAGFGGIHQFGSSYRFGYKYESTGLRVYDKTEQAGSYYYYDKGNNLFTSGQTEGSVGDNPIYTQAVIFGHSFLAADHEFLTDSRFNATDASENTYNFFQTFGYKLNFSNQMQFMTGASYEFDTNAKYVSAGYSWLTNTLRSTISAYHAEDGSDMQSTGFTFGSEFIY